MPPCSLGRAALWLPWRSLTEGRLVVVVPVRPCVPAVGLELTVGLVEAVAEPVLPEALPVTLLVVGRTAVTLPLDEPPDMLPPLATRAWSSSGRRWLMEPAVPLLPCLTLAT